MGAWGRPARSAAWTSVSFEAGFEKYVRAAACAPYACLPVEDLVEVLGEDLLPGVLLEPLFGEARLLDLARQRPLRVADEEVPHELLGDRRAALNDLPVGDVLVERAEDAPVVERAVLPETGVLDRHRRLRQRGRDLGERQRLPVRRRGDDAEELPVVHVEERVLAERERTEILEGALRRQDLLAREGHGGEQQRDDRRNEQCSDQQDAAALAVTAAQPTVPREQHALELDVRARRLPPLRPSPVTTLIARHCSAIVLDAAGRQPDAA